VEIFARNVLAEFLMFAPAGIPFRNGKCFLERTLPSGGAIKRPATSGLFRGPDKWRNSEVKLRGPIYIHFFRPDDVLLEFPQGL